MLKTNSNSGANSAATTRSPVPTRKPSQSYTDIGTLILSQENGTVAVPKSRFSRFSSSQRPSTVDIGINSAAFNRRMEHSDSLPALNYVYKRHASVLPDVKRPSYLNRRKRSMPVLSKPVVFTLSAASLMDSKDFERNEKLVPVSMIRSFFELSAPLINGEMLHFSRLEGKVVLVTNIATADKNTTKELFQLNDLVMNYGSKGLIVLAFPCDQFGGRESAWENDEFVQCLKFVRPGRNFEPRFNILGKCDVNGEKTHPIFEFLKQRLPLPADDVATFVKDPRDITWRPVMRSDVTGNFEKFIVAPDGQPVRRYTSKTRPGLLGGDLEPLLKKIPRNHQSRNSFNFNKERNYDFSYKEKPATTRGSVLGQAGYTSGQWGS